MFPDTVSALHPAKSCDARRKPQGLAWVRAGVIAVTVEPPSSEWPELVAQRAGPKALCESHSPP